MMIVYWVLGNMSTISFGQKKARFPGLFSLLELDFPNQGINPLGIIVTDMPLGQESVHGFPVVGFHQQVGISTSWTIRVKVNDLDFMIP
jgi:hypothetical protein